MAFKNNSFPLVSYYAESEEFMIDQKIKRTLMWLKYITVCGDIRGTKHVRMKEKRDILILIFRGLILKQGA